jgi:hypothetical protein
MNLLLMWNRSTPIADNEFNDDKLIYLQEIS